MASVTFLTIYGGDGTTVSDDRNPLTGLRGGGYQTRFIPALTNVLNIAAFVQSKADEALNSATSSANSSLESLGASQLAASQASAAAGSATSAATAATNAANSAVQANNTFNATVEFVSNSDLYKPFASYAAALAGFSALPEGAIIKVLVDENFAGRSTYYLVDLTDPIALNLDFSTGLYQSGFAYDRLVFVREEDFNRVTVAPANATSPGRTGDIFIDENFLYYCYAPDSWRRIAGSTF